MADIVNPQVKLHSNKYVRTVVDRFVASYYALISCQGDYTGQGIAAKINAEGASNFIADESETDGRPRATGTAVINTNAALTQLKTAMDTTLIPGVGTTIMALFSTLQVNGAPR
jgi:hypothetical protein